jgi:Spy/CpxP family protein refolding chaperone
MNKNVKIFFTVSVLLNLLLIGLMAGQAYKTWADEPWRRGDITKKLSPEGQAIVKNLMREAVPRKDEHFQSMADMRAEMGTLLRADPFDPEAFDALTSRMVTLKTRMTRDRMGTTKEIALSLVPEDRKAFSESFMHMREKHWDEAFGSKQTMHKKKDIDSAPSVPKGRAEEPSAPELPDDMPPMPGIQE